MIKDNFLSNKSCMKYKNGQGRQGSHVAQIENTTLLGGGRGGGGLGPGGVGPVRDIRFDLYKNEKAIIVK